MQLRRVCLSHDNYDHNHDDNNHNNDDNHRVAVRLWVSCLVRRLAL